MPAHERALGFRLSRILAYFVIPLPVNSDCFFPHGLPRLSPLSATHTTRRSFLAKAAAIVIGGALAITAPVAGLFVFLDPLRRKSDSGGAVLVASLNALPENGEPRKFSVLATRVDAWNRSPNGPIGAVYLQRVGDKVRALNVVCPHAGCFVDYRGAKNHFFI